MSECYTHHAESCKGECDTRNAELSSLRQQLAAGWWKERERAEAAEQESASLRERLAAFACPSCGEPAWDCGCDFATEWSKSVEAHKEKALRVAAESRASEAVKMSDASLEVARKAESRASEAEKALAGWKKGWSNLDGLRLSHAKAAEEYRLKWVDALAKVSEWEAKAGVLAGALKEAQGCLTRIWQERYVGSNCEYYKGRGKYVDLALPTLDHTLPMVDEALSPAPVDEKCDEGCQHRNNKAWPHSHWCPVKPSEGEKPSQESALLCDNKCAFGPEYFGDHRPDCPSRRRKP